MKIKNFVLFLLLGFMSLGVATGFAAQCKSCHEPSFAVEKVDKKIQQATWSDVMKNFSIKADAADPTIEQKLDINGKPVREGFYPRYVDLHPCYDTSGLSAPSYTAKDRIHDASLPLSDMIENNPGAVGLKGGASSSGGTFVAKGSALCK